MQTIKTVYLSNFLREECDLKDKIDEINDFYNDDRNEEQFEPCQDYLCLGFTMMCENIVLVSNHGRVFTLPYDEKYIHDAG